jgi:hypothetical protein
LKVAVDQGDLGTGDGPRPAGIYLWRDQHGATYLVDHTGTRRLPRPRIDLVLEWAA